MIAKKEKNENKKIPINFYVVFIFLVLFLIALFSALNLVTIIKLNEQIKNTFIEQSLNSLIPRAPALEPKQSPTLESKQLSATETEKIPEIKKVTYTQVYSNAASEPFFNSSYVNQEQTNLHLDEAVTALTFEPLYNLSYEKSCSDSLCGLLKNNNPACLANGCLIEDKGEIYFNNKKISLPEELRTEKDLSFSFSPLEKKWVIAAMFKKDKQEIVYAYLFNGDSLKPLINQESQEQINTKFGRGGGNFSAGGSDDKFILMYSGYEIIAYLYNQGSFQNISSYFGLRVADGGFKAKIIRDNTNWYICSDDLNKAKLIKLWQNNSQDIQGAIDLSGILGGEGAICSLRNNHQLSIARRLGGKNDLYLFKDEGFDNTKTYKYQSNNLSNYKGKIILNANLSSYVINADLNSYSLEFSSDGVNWLSGSKGAVDLEAGDKDTFYLKADFKNGNKDYSPWLGGFDLISYSAADRP